MKAIDRIYQYIDFKQIKIVDFEKKNSISNGYLSKMKIRSAGIGEDILNSILENCPDISPEWLLTGKGEMLRPAGTDTGPAGGHTIRSDVTAPASGGMSMDVFWDRYDKVVAERDRLRAQIAELQREKRGDTSKAIYADDPEKLVAAEAKINKK